MPASKLFVQQESEGEPRKMNRLAAAEVGCLRRGGRSGVIMGPIKGAGVIQGSCFRDVKVVLKRAE